MKQVFKVFVILFIALFISTKENEVFAQVACNSPIMIDGDPNSGGIPPCACNNVRTVLGRQVCEVCADSGCSYYVSGYDLSLCGNLLEGRGYCGDGIPCCPENFTCLPTGNTFYCETLDECSNVGECGAAGGCDVGSRCVYDNDLGYNLCDIDETCSDVLEDECDRYGFCGIEAGCSYGERCIKPDFSVSYCSSDSTCLDECSVTFEEFDSRECGLGGCPEDHRCEPRINTGIWEEADDFRCVVSVHCAETQCGAFNQPCCPGMYDTQQCPYNSTTHPVLICESVGGIDTCIDDYTVGPITFERRPGHPYGGPLLRIETLMQGIFKILYPVAIILGVAFFVKGGYAYMTSEGDPQKVKAAQGEITNAIVGALFVLLSAAILRIIISNVLGVPVSL